VVSDVGPCQPGTDQCVFRGASSAAEDRAPEREARRSAAETIVLYEVPQSLKAFDMDVKRRKTILSIFLHSLFTAIILKLIFSLHSLIEVSLLFIEQIYSLHS